MISVCQSRLRESCCLAVTWIALGIALHWGNTLPAAEPVTDDVSFRADVDGSEERYVRVLPADFDPAQTHDLLVVLHGHGSNRWQFVKDARDECQAAREFAARHRMIYVSPDYRATTSWMGPKAEADVVQILHELKQAYKIRHVILSGASMGGTASLTFAVLHPEQIDAVVSMNGTANHVEYRNFQDAISSSFGGDKVQAAEEYRRRSAEFFPERLTMPLACTTGGKDNSVPAASVVRLAAALKKLKRPVHLIHQSAGGHATSYADATQAYEFVFDQLQTE